MKLAVVSILTAAALTMGGCSHMSETAARSPVPVTSLTADEIRAELAGISQQLSDISRTSGEDLRRSKSQTQMAAFNAGVIGRSAIAPANAAFVEGPTERRPTNSAKQLNRVESLLKRQDELRAQLKVSERQG